MNLQERLWAIESIKQLKARYFRYVDTQDWQGFRTVLHDDAKFYVSREQQIRAGMKAEDVNSEEALCGGDVIVEFVANSLRDASSVHHGYMPEIEITSEDTARGVWTMEDYVQWPGVSLHGMGHYIETYARRDGEWRISTFQITRLRVDNDPAVDLENHVGRLRVLEHERNILIALARYGHSIDYGRDADWVDCFCADGVFDMRVMRDPRAFDRDYGYGTRHELGVRFEGHQQLQAFISRETPAPETYLKHVVVEPVITLDADDRTAHVISYFLLTAESTSGPIVAASGRYLDTLVRCNDEIWRFRERIAEVESMTPVAATRTS
ncbi:MAG: nuclear transport factor 2 family protein [Steroidobacteraceae bacterium]